MLIIICVVLIVLLVGGGAAAYFLMQDKVVETTTPPPPAPPSGPPPPPPLKWVALSAPGKTWAVSNGNTRVRYGKDQSWIEKTWAAGNNYECNTDEFGSEPAPGSTCEIVEDDMKNVAEIQQTWVLMAADGSSFRLNGNARVRYGVGNRWIYKTIAAGEYMPGWITTDPAPGVVKSYFVDSRDVSKVVWAPYIDKLNWSIVANEGQTRSVTGSAPVKYGAAKSWIMKEIPMGGTFTCNSTYFGGDPIYGTSKNCMTTAPENIKY